MRKPDIHRMTLAVSKDAALRIHAAAVARTQASVGTVTIGMVVTELATRYLDEAPPDTETRQWPEAVRAKIGASQRKRVARAKRQAGRPVAMSA